MPQVIKINAQVGHTSGNYQVQAKGNNLLVWTALDTEVGEPQNGVFKWPDLTIGADVLIPGNVYLLRIVDTTSGLSSNTVRLVMP